MWAFRPHYLCSRFFCSQGVFECVIKVKESCDGIKRTNENVFIITKRPPVGMLHLDGNSALELHHWQHDDLWSTPPH